MARERLRVATRGSDLARWQASWVARRLGEAHPGLDTELVLVETSGDLRRDVPIPELGGQGVFVKEVQGAVADGRADVAVHSAKDLPSVATAGLHLAAIPVRGDPRDALVGCRLADLPDGGVVATGSVRRQAQLAARRPDLVFVGLRGNIGTRLARADAFDAIVVAAAALHRLGLEAHIAETLPPEVMLPQVGQGALAVECRSADAATRALLAVIDDLDARVAVEAERGFLARLGGGCDLPVGAHATVDSDGVVTIEGVVASHDGQLVLRHRGEGSADSPGELGAALADRLLHRARGTSLLEALGGGGRPTAPT